MEQVDVAEVPQIPGREAHVDPGMTSQIRLDLNDA